MYVKPTSTRFSRGRSTPEILAMLYPLLSLQRFLGLALALLVLRICADHANDAFTTNDLAALAASGH
jgi:hypothetical protein